MYKNYYSITIYYKICCFYPAYNGSSCWSISSTDCHDKLEQTDKDISSFIDENNNRIACIPSNLGLSVFKLMVITYNKDVTDGVSAIYYSLENADKIDEYLR